MKIPRSFLPTLILITACLGLFGYPAGGQSPGVEQAPQNPLPGQRPQTPDTEAPPLPNPDKKMLENNDKDIKKKVEQLYQLARELKTEVEKTDSSKVLSLNLVKKAEEIEKLAHDIKNRSKG